MTEPKYDHVGNLETMDDWRSWLTEQKYIPLDKSWVIRMGFLDLTRGYKDIVGFLETQTDLGDDLTGLLRVCQSWEGNGPLDVGESGTILRFVRYYLWKNNIKREIKVTETLEERSKNRISNDPNIVNMGPEELGELDDKTSQWQTVAYVFGDRRRVNRPKYKLRLTYQSVEHWEERRRKGQCWDAITDETITRQVLGFIEYMKTGKISSKPQQPEDFFFYEMFGIKIDPSIAYEYESLQGHETKRLDTLREISEAVSSGDKIKTKDHRGVTAAAMYMKTRDKSLSVADIRKRFEHPDCVTKAFPRFWECMEAVFARLD
jgi:hypothetical protein